MADSKNVQIIMDKSKIRQTVLDTEAVERAKGMLARDLAMSEGTAADKLAHVEDALWYLSRPKPDGKPHKAADVVRMATGEKRPKVPGGMQRAFHVAAAHHAASVARATVGWDSPISLLEKLTGGATWAELADAANSVKLALVDAGLARETGIRQPKEDRTPKELCRAFIKSLYDRLLKAENGQAKQGTKAVPAFNARELFKLTLDDVAFDDGQIKNKVAGVEDDPSTMEQAGIIETGPVPADEEQRERAARVKEELPPSEDHHLRTPKKNRKAP